MTTLSILNGDFEILLDDETVGSNAVAGMRMVRRASGASSTVYTTVALYSAVAAAMDDFIAMGFTNAMLPVTPNAFTMENQYFIPRSSTEFLKEGTITANWALSGIEGVYRKPYVDSTAFVAGDIGRQVVESASGDTGTLLDFEVEPDGTNVLWIRPDAADDVFDSVSGTIGVVADGGTGVSGTLIAGQEATIGETVYTAIQAIGSVPTATEVYVVQDRLKMTDSTGGFQWWATDPTLSLGIISILIRTKVAGVNIADQDVEVFARRYTSLYDNFRLNVAAGGFSALPLASAPDINNTTGYFDGAWDAGTGSAMSVGDLLTNTFSGKEGGRYIVTAVSDSGATGTFTWYEVGDLTPFADNDTFTGTRSGTIQGTPTAAVGGPTETGAGNGGTVTIAFGHTLVDHDGVGGTEPYSVTIDAQGDVPIAKVYERIKYVTRRGASAADLFSTPNNMTGERYRGLDAIIEYDANTGTLGAGEDLLTTTGGNTWTAVLLAQNTTNSPTYISVMDQQTSVDSLVDDDVIEDEAGTEDVTFHAGGTIGNTSIAAVKASPFGTFTGSQIFGARGISYINPAGADTQAYILTDDLGVLRTPPNTVTLTVDNTIAGDHVFVARDTGVAGVINKDQFGGMAAASPGVHNSYKDNVIRAAGTVDVEVADSGFVRVVNTGLQEEHHYVYDSRTTGALGEFTLRAVNNQTGVTASGTNETTLVVTGATFTSAPVVLPGMLVMNDDATNGGLDVYEVVSVDNATTLTIKKLYGSGTWTVGDDYFINLLIADHDAVPASVTDYGTEDNLYDLIIDEEASGGTSSNSFVKTAAADFTWVVNVRNGKNILPFTQNQLQQDNSVTVVTVRTPDTIAV